MILTASPVTASHLQNLTHTTATRYEKRAINYLAMLTIGMSLLWL